MREPFVSWNVSVFRSVAAVAVAALLSVCGGASDTPTTPSVTAGHVATVVVGGTPTGPMISGQSVTLAVTTLDRDRQTITGFPVVWTTSDTLVAKVTPSATSGILTARNPGSATITAYSDGQQASIAITVVPIPVAAVKLSVTSSTLYGGGQVRITATAVDSLGRALAGRAVVWTTFNAQVAKVDAGGLVSAVGAGTASVTASSEGKSTSAPVTVIARPTSDWSAVTDEWLNYQGNALHTGYVPATLDPTLFKDAWTSTPMPAVALNPVTVADNKVFVSTNAYFGKEILAVLDATSGAVQWTHDFGAIHSVDPPTYANGTVYVAPGGQGDSYI